MNALLNSTIRTRRLIPVNWESELNSRYISVPSHTHGSSSDYFFLFFCERLIRADSRFRSVLQFGRFLSPIDMEYIYIVHVSKYSFNTSIFYNIRNVQSVSDNYWHTRCETHQTERRIPLPLCKQTRSILSYQLERIGEYDYGGLCSCALVIWVELDKRKSPLPFYKWPRTNMWLLIERETRWGIYSDLKIRTSVCKIMTVRLIARISTHSFHTRFLFRTGWQIHLSNCPSLDLLLSNQLWVSLSNDSCEILQRDE